MTDKIKVFLVDDHSIVRSGLKLILELDKRIEVCGEAKNLQETLDTIGECKPDVVLLDFKLPDGDGVNGCLAIKSRLPQTKIIILTAYSQAHLVMETIRAGADGYLLKNVKGEELIDNIIKVYQGDSILDSAVTESILDLKTKFAMQLTSSGPIRPATTAGISWSGLYVKAILTITTQPPGNHSNTT